MPREAWTDDELQRVGEAEELELSSVRSDKTLRRPVVMWVVRHGDDIYVRSVNGRSSSWFHGVQTKQPSARCPTRGTKLRTISVTVQ
jgi:hypothetical protein